VAQQQPRPDSGQLEEIVVTAEKRESTVQNTPISLTAVSGADIQARGLTDLSTLMQSVPGVSIRSSGPGLTEFEMRGVASTGGNSPTVGFYYDDTPLTAPASTNDFGSSNLFTYYNPTKLLQQSVFGEMTYNITSAFAATVGLRRYHYDESVFTDQYGALTAASLNYTAVTDQGVLPKGSLSYKFSDDFLLYATAAKGFRPGGGTGPVPTSGPKSVNCELQLQGEYGSTSFVPGPTSFKSDRVWSYEIGEKLTAFNDRVTVDSAIYFES
jgi:outer membrane receptor protein involved in Fe transport